MTYKVLVMDDDRVTLEMMDLILQKIGYEPCTSYTIPDALEIIRNDRPDLILLDLQMTPVDGWGFLDALFREKPAVDIPVMLFTARYLLPEEYARYGSRVVGVLEKPVSLPELKTVLDGFFEGR
ncbi:MAG: hypothetical protein PWP08_1492 [Methanofollis sp.]|nr:hypothetical protein [Methanofollis sp.]